MYLKQIGTYWDTRAEGYSFSIRSQLCSEVGDYFRKILKDSAPKGNGLSCLDIGCGPGFFSILLAQEGHLVTAVDYSENMLCQAARNFSEMGVEVSTKQGDAQNLPFPDGSFDYIVSRNLVWNLEQPEHAYREWLRLLKPGGHLLVADGNHYLHYYDDDYLCAKENTSQQHNCYGVDPTPINKIAHTLPLSQMHRPAWDMDKLLQMGIDQINTRVSRTAYTDPDSGENKSLIADFVICARKPVYSVGENKEHQHELAL